MGVLCGFHPPNLNWVSPCRTVASASQSDRTSDISERRGHAGFVNGRAASSEVYSSPAFFTKRIRLASSVESLVSLCYPQVLAALSFALERGSTKDTAVSGRIVFDHIATAAAVSRRVGRNSLISN